MKVLFILIFAISTGIHLYASLKKNTRLRNYTKPFILPALIGLYVVGASEVRIAIVLALIFSWIGDLFLMIKGVKWFAIGGVSFMIGHFFFILGYNKDVDFSKVNIGYVIGLSIFFLIVVTIIFSKLKKHLPKALFYPMYLYLFVNGTMNNFAFFRMMSGTSTNAIITLIGAILFFISDSSLFFVRFDKNSLLKTHFLVMLTYSIGEFLIVLGLL